MRIPEEILLGEFIDQKVNKKNAWKGKENVALHTSKDLLIAWSQI